MIRAGIEEDEAAGLTRADACVLEVVRGEEFAGVTRDRPQDALEPVVVSPDPGKATSVRLKVQMGEGTMQLSVDRAEVVSRSGPTLEDIDQHPVKGGAQATRTFECCGSLTWMLLGHLTQPVVTPLADEPRLEGKLG
jgi:hypothetical protein